MKAIILVIAWIWIAAPLGWGVYQSVQKSIPLFNDSAKSAATQQTSTSPSRSDGRI